MQCLLKLRFDFHLLLFASGELLVQTFDLQLTREKVQRRSKIKKGTYLLTRRLLILGKDRLLFFILALQSSKGFLGLIQHLLGGLKLLFHGGTILIVGLVIERLAALLQVPKVSGFYT